MKKVISVINTVAIVCVLAISIFLDNELLLGVVMLLVSWDIAFEYYSGDVMYAGYSKPIESQLARNLSLLLAIAVGGGGIYFVFK